LISWFVISPLPRKRVFCGSVRKHGGHLLPKCR
jgi:hypothetical protein